MNTRSPFLAIFVALLCASMAVAAADRQRPMATIADNAPVTIVPEAGRTPLATLPEGTQVQLLGPEEDGWYKIAFQDNYLLGERVGYVRAEHLRVAAPTPASPSSSLAKPPASNTATAPTTGTTDRGSRRNISESRIVEAIVAGRAHKDAQGLQLLENGQPWRPSSNMINSRFRLQIHTPLAWIKQLASDAATESRTFMPDDVTEEMTEPVLRVTTYSKALTPVSGSRTGWVRHVVLRNATKDAIVQPVSKHPFSEHVLTGQGTTTIFEGLQLTFPLEAVRRLRGPGGDGELIISVVGVNGEEKDLRITREYFQRLPM
jgi:hypothetical protein